MKAYVVGGARTPFVKSMTFYKNVSTQDLMIESLKNLIKKFSLDGKIAGDVVLGAVMNSSSNWNMARESVLKTSLHPHTPGMNIQRACATSLDAANIIAMKIHASQIGWGIAGGVDTNSDIAIEVSKSLSHKLLLLNAAKSFSEKIKIIASLKPSDLKPRTPAVVEPRTKLSMGQHTEKMVQEWGIGRLDQDELAYISHKNGESAYAEGFHTDLVFEFQGLKKDSILRGDTSVEKLSKLKPAFDFSGRGTLTAGNSSPLTDGSSAVLLAGERALKENNWEPLSRFVDCEVASVDFIMGEGLLIAPTIAVSRLLERNKMKLQDFDFYEIHEAFSGQVLVTLKAWESEDYCKRVLGRSSAMGPIDRSKMNIKGGSVAMGHPFAATGGRIISVLSKILKQKKGRGLISVCTAGGMGVAAILESV